MAAESSRVPVCGSCWEKEAEKIHARRDGAEGGGVDVLGFFVKLLEEGFEGGGHVRDGGQPGEAGVAGKGVDAAIEIEDFLEAVLVVVGLDQVLQRGAQGGQGGGWLSTKFLRRPD